MKARLFLVAFGLITIVAAESLAQFGGSTQYRDYNKGYNKGYNEGYRKGSAAARNGTWLGNYHTLSSQHPNRPTSYERGLLDGYVAARDSVGTGYGGLSINGVNIGNPFAAVGQTATNYQQAYQESIQNEQLCVQSYYDERRMNTSYGAEQQMQHPHATPEELAAFSRARLPEQLSADEFDPARGVIQWPGVLNRPEFAESRTSLEGLFQQAAADPHASGVGTQNYRDIEHAVEDMSEKLHSEIAQFAPMEYIAASKFLKKLLYHARVPPANAPA
jgi:hypothetical protein